MLCTRSYSRVVCVKSPHSLVSRSFGFWHKQAREYNPVQSTFYDVNYIFDKKTTVTEDESGSEGKFWRRNRQRARKWGEEAIRINRSVNYRLMQLTQSFHLVLNMIWFLFLLQITRNRGRPDIMLFFVALRKEINVVLVVYPSWHC